MKTTSIPRTRSAPIDMPADEFRSVGHALVDKIADFLSTIRQRPVTPAEPPSHVKAVLNSDTPLPESGRDAGQVVSRAADLLFDHSLFNSHPRFLGYITSSAAPIGMLGDLLAAATNPNLGSWTLAPMASEIESQTIRWLAELIGYPEPRGGLLVSGGTMANFVGLLAARAAKVPWDVRKLGLNHPSAKHLRIYTSAETHTWIQKAADCFGFGTDNIRWIPTDDRQRLDVVALRKAIDADLAHGDHPFLVIGTAGSVSTGATDPLREIAAVCRDYDLWFHVDGAYGGLAAGIAGAPEDLKGLSMADSVAIDPHKWLYAPLEAGAVLVRNPEDLRNAFSYHPPYYHFDEEVLNYVDYGMQNSRGFRALKVWLALQQVGREGYARMIEDDIRLAGAMFDAMHKHPEMEAVTHELSITTFRFVPEDLREGVGSEPIETYLNDLNKELLTALERSGEAFVSPATVKGRFLLRACIVNFRTSLEDIEALPEIVSRLGRRVDAEMRAEKLAS